MNDIRQIRQRILERYQRDPQIRVNVSIARLHLNDIPVKISGVYAHIFQVEESSSGLTKRYTLQYTDVLTHNIEILDM